MEQNYLNSKLLALSWKQPYAELMLHGKIETRTWPAKYRGWVLICASKQSYNDKQVESISGIIQLKRIHKITKWECITDYYKLITGHAIAIGKLVDCRPMKKSDEDKCFVQYYPDLFCHIYENVQAIQPIPWKGTQGWKEVDKEFKKKIVLL